MLQEEDFVSNSLSKCKRQAPLDVIYSSPSSVSNGGPSMCERATHLSMTRSVKAFWALVCRTESREACYGPIPDPAQQRKTSRSESHQQRHCDHRPFIGPWERTQKDTSNCALPSCAQDGTNIQGKMWHPPTRGDGFVQHTGGMRAAPSQSACLPIHTRHTLLDLPAPVPFCGSGGYPLALLPNLASSQAAA